MKRAASLAAVALVTLAVDARADEFAMDLRTPVRTGFAYTALTNAPAFSLSFGVDLDVLPITNHLSLTVVVDTEANSRPDLPEDARLASFGGFGGGVGLFYLSDGQVGFGVESTAWATFDNMDIAGGGVAARAYVIPFYVRVDKAADRDGDHFAAWVRSSISFWVMGRMDWTIDGNAATIAAGLSVDITRLLFLPYIAGLQKIFR